MLVRLRENGADTRRKKTYQPLVTVSRGYDSVACAALGVAAGWKDAVTLVSKEPDDPDSDDDGTPVAEQLGLSIEKFDTQAWRQLPDVPETEFIATAWGGVMVRFASMVDSLQDTLLVFGNVADRTWQPGSSGVQPNWGRPRTMDILSMGQESFWEFQLRVGFFTVFPAAYAAVHWNALYQIMTGEEMQAWSVGGDYDRPLPRRIAEEMGVPRELFGQKKMAMGHVYPGKTPSVNGYEDYVRFLQEVGTLNKNEKFTHELKEIMPYFFHWGIDRTMRRYDISCPDDPE